MLWVLLLLIVSTNGVVYMEQKDWKYLESHPIKNKMSFDNSDIQKIVSEEWKNLVSLCPTLDPNANIHATFDQSLTGSNTLAWASQTMFISGNIWMPALIDIFYSGYDFRIGVNPSPPNGRYDGDCSDISYRYDLRTVIRHELLHGVGLSSSISYSTSWTVGDYQASFCFPRLFDTKIKDQNNNLIVSGCSIGDITSKKLYISDVQIYNPSVFDSGSSLSHHNYPGHLFYYRSEPMKCMFLSSYETKMLSEIGIHCSSDQRSESEARSVPILLFLSCLFFVSFLLW